MGTKNILSVLSVLLLFLTSCQDDLTDKLQGKWQLKTVEQSGVITEVDTVWYNFQSESLFMYQIYDTEKDSFLHWYGFRVQQDEHTMELELGYNPEVPVSDFLLFTDWESKIRVFEIRKVDRKHLTLYSGEKTYLFTKFE